MALFLPNQASASLRAMSLWLLEDDGVTPVAASLIPTYQGAYASRTLSGTATVAGMIVSWGTLGSAFNYNGGTPVTLALVTGGSGAGSMSNTGNAYTFTYAVGITTVANLVTALTTAGFTVGGTYTSSATLQSGDAFSALSLAGGLNNSLFTRQNGTAGAAVRSASGTLLNGFTGSLSGLAGDGIYTATQAELNFTGTELQVFAQRSPTPASLAPGTSHINSTFYVKTSVGQAGDAVTLQLVGDGSGSGTLNESAFPAVVFHFAEGTTTLANLEAAIVASTNLGIQAYGTWTNVLTSADVMAATAFSGGLSYMQQTWESDMLLGTFENVDEAGYTYGQTHRLKSSIMGGTVTDFRTGTNNYKSLDGSKTRYTENTSADGRDSITIGDLTP